jgi:GNAT superfamily N-acetyltransferase
VGDAPASQPVRVHRVRTPKALRLFREFVYQLHGEDPCWVAPLRRDQDILLDRDRHPFHQHARVEYFLATRGREVVGRVAAIENFRHNAVHEEKAGFFGFLDAVNDREVFAALLGTAERWARARGLECLRGPCSFSTNEECGLLVTNHSAPPVVMTPWNPPHYQQHVEALGFAKAEDLLCYWLTQDAFQGRIHRLAAAVEKRLERQGLVLRVRHMDKKRFAEEVEVVRALYNQAWEKNWGFVPLTDDEITFLAKELRPIVVPEMVVFAELNGETVGFAMALPDYNIVLRHMGGRLTPRSIATALVLRRDIHHVRIWLLGLLPEHRNRGLDLLLYRALFDNGTPIGYHAAELSWILERNATMRRGCEAMGAYEWRRYRVYEKGL